MRWKTIGVQLLEKLYAEPEEWSRMLDRAASGTPWAKVLEERSITWGAWALWRRDNPDAEQDVLDARSCYAECAVFEARDLADDAKPDNVQVAKLRGDRRWQLAARLDRSSWGEKEQQHAAGITINLVQFTEDQVLAGAPRRVLEGSKAVTGETPLLTKRETAPL